MKKLKLVAVGAIAAAMLLAGCGAQPGEVTQELTGQTAPGLAHSVASKGAQYEPLAVDENLAAVIEDKAFEAGPALDGRAAAAAEAGDVGALAAQTGTLARWYTGNLAAGAQQHWTWNNASSTSVYKVGFAPSGGSTAGSCRFQVVRQWDVMRPSGEREFHFIIENIGGISCGANVHLQRQAAASTWATGQIGPGATQGWTWNNANPLTAAHFVSVDPTGATPSYNCELEVTRTWYAQKPSGEREFRFHIKNVGTIACGGNVLLAVNTGTISSWATTTALNPGASMAWYWNNANPLNRVYVPGVSPLGATSNTDCQLEMLDSYYLEQLDNDHTTQRRYYIGVKNVGTIACSGTILLNALDPVIGNPLPANLFPQQTSMWCWAASGQMVMSYLGGMMSQCEQANQRFGRTDCCNSPIPAACVKGGWPEFGKYGFTYNTGGALSWASLKAQIDTNKTPFAFSWAWDGGGGHMMVVTGYKVISGQNWVSIHDPWSPNEGDIRDILYSDYVDGTGYSHWTDYYNVAN